jgi:hypothetical protein
VDAGQSHFHARVPQAGKKSGDSAAVQVKRAGQDREGRGPVPIESTEHACEMGTSELQCTGIMLAASALTADRNMHPGAITD